MTEVDYDKPCPRCGVTDGDPCRRLSDGEPRRDHLDRNSLALSPARIEDVSRAVSQP
jgi:hypothetical protein